jgi:RimJ/RimL family protein N-acetyltransferase
MEILLETSRLRLRQFTQTDVPLLVDLDSDPRVMQYINGGIPTSEIDIREQFLARVFRYYEDTDGLGVWAAEHADDHAFMGWFHLFPNPDSADILEIGYRLKHDFWGQGFATEGAAALIEYGFARPEVTKVIANAMPDNHGSTNIMKKLGMTFETEYTHPKGMLVVQYGIDRATYMASTMERP